MKLLKFLLVVGLAFIVAACAEAQEPFYKGKTVRLVVGFSAGGGFDVYSRAISRHLGKHLPGKPDRDCRKHDRGRQPGGRQSHFQSC